MLSFRDIAASLRRLEIDPVSPVIAHASLSAFGEVHSGADTLLGALLMTFHTLIMPAFTYKTMITPEAGPPNNAMLYGSGKDANRMAEFYQPDMPADRLMGRVAEALRRHPKARRSLHPILSFSGVNADAALEAQTLDEPLAPIRMLHQQGGWVLLLGVDHEANTSIHYAERLSGRKQFIRWALTPQGVVACPGFPGCSDGFQKIEPALIEIVRKVEVGNTTIQAFPLDGLVEAVQMRIEKDYHALLCSSLSCERCAETRREFTTAFR